MTYSRAATDYIAGPCSVGPVRAWTASDVAAAFDAGAASVTVRAEPITTYRQPERVLTTSEFLRTAEDALVRDKHGSIRSIRSARVTDDGPYTLVYDPTAPASPPVPAPVLLTADDPRIKPGARVQYRIDTTLVNGLADGATHDARLVSACIRAQIPQNPPLWTIQGYPAVYLIAEAPDPDVDVRVALNLASRDNLDEMLANLREHDWDVVKVARS